MGSDKHGRLLIQLQAELAASVTQAICKYLMSKTIYILNDGMALPQVSAFT
jgi:hypothetical protein